MILLCEKCNVFFQTLLINNMLYITAWEITWSWN